MPLNGEKFAKQWEDGWNSHKLDDIMSHYRDDVVFHSKKAVSLVGAGELRGKDALHQYWSAALKRQPDLKFLVQEVFEGHNMLAILYVNHHGIRAVESLYFDDDELVIRAAACHHIGDG